MCEYSLEELYDYPRACGGARLFGNVFEMLLDGLFCQSHFLSDLLISPAFQEMLDNRGFACGQLKPLLRLENDFVVPHADPDFVHHDEDSISYVSLIHQGRAAQENGATARGHYASELKLLPVLLIGPDCEELPDLINEARDGWREYPICCFPVLALNDLLTQFPCPSILIQ
jgi:hypothetical protein